MKLHKSSACFLGRHNAHFIIHTTEQQAFITGKRNFAISKQREDCVTHNHTSQRTKNRLFFYSVFAMGALVMLVRADLLLELEHWRSSTLSHTIKCLKITAKRALV
jgi:hypothetical protein